MSLECYFYFELLFLMYAPSCRMFPNKYVPVADLLQDRNGASLFSNVFL